MDRLREVAVDQRLVVASVGVEAQSPVALGVVEVAHHCSALAVEEGLHCSA